ncbi:MAG: hypothetical protein WBH90_16120 [Aggregatilineales bacterium]|nr:hypothetical protein [Chloroflexota bacterium]HPT61244.1 hypothetical protein [Bacillota bacterium]
MATTEQMIERVEKWLNDPAYADFLDKHLGPESPNAITMYVGMTHYARLLTGNDDLFTFEHTADEDAARRDQFEKLLASLMITGIHIGFMLAVAGPPPAEQPGRELTVAREVDRVDVVRLIGQEVGRAKMSYPERFQQYYTIGAVMIIISKLVYHVTQKGGPGVEVIYMPGHQQIEIWEPVGAGGCFCTGAVTLSTV